MTKFLHHSPCENCGSRDNLAVYEDHTYCFGCQQYNQLNGELPDVDKKNEFINILTNHTMLHEQILTFYSGFRRDSHPMAIMVGIVGALSSFYSEKTHDFSSMEGKWVAVSRLLAKMPTIAAMAYKYSLGQPFIYPKTAGILSRMIWIILPTVWIQWLRKLI